MLKAIIFDMDGVIVKSEETYRKGFNNIMKEFVISISKQEWLERFTGRGVSYIVNTVFDENKLQNKEKWRNRWIREYEKLVEIQGLEEVAGFFEFNLVINKTKLKKAVASGSSKESILLTLRKLGIEEEFVVASSEDLKKGKPSPEIFLKAATALRVKPEECVVFEDSVAGVKAAKNARMKCIALTTTEKASALKKVKPDMIIRDFEDITLEKVSELFKS